VTHVGMESTGVYWRPVYTVLEGHFELIVGNARHIRNVPGRKTDVKDAEWIADLVRHGLIAKSFVPARPLRELRELLRYRRKLVESQSAERNRLLKLLETANIKLASVASDVFGASGRAMLKTLSEGNTSAEEIAGLAKGQLRRKHDELVLALEGRVEEHHRFLLAIQLHRLEAAEHDIEALDSRIAERLEPYRTQHALLMQIPGVDWVVAAVLIALTEGPQILQPVVGGIAVQVRRCEHDARHPKPGCLHKVGPTGRASTAIPPCRRLFVEPAPVRQAAEEGKVGSATALAPSSSALEADVAAQLAPVRGIERSQLGAYGHVSLSKLLRPVVFEHRL
jgi:hypothetical protein